MITYQEATLADAEAIAQLHAQSWRHHYRGIMRDAYLDHAVHEDRQTVWVERLLRPSVTQHVVLAVNQSELCGFACTYAQHDPQWGALLDNLHVSSTWQGKGIGRSLLQQSAQWVSEQAVSEGLYLWVFEKNTAARAFYDQQGGIKQDQTIVDNPGGGQAAIFRYVWPELSTLTAHNPTACR